MEAVDLELRRLVGEYIKRYVGNREADKGNVRLASIAAKHAKDTILASVREMVSTEDACGEVAGADSVENLSLESHVKRFQDMLLERYRGPPPVPGSTACPGGFEEGFSGFKEPLREWFLAIVAKVQCS